jgi:CBS domain-containing membrane protein
MHNLTAADVMTPDPTVLHASHRLQRAWDEMSAGRFRHLPVVDRDGRLLGVLTHRDLLAAQGELSRRADEVMQTNVKAVEPDTLAHEAAYLLLRHAIGCVPVVDGEGRLLGIVTESDFVRIAYTALGGRVSIDQIESEEREADKV